MPMKKKTGIELNLFWPVYIYNYICSCLTSQSTALVMSWRSPSILWNFYPTFRWNNTSSPAIKHRHTTYPGFDPHSGRRVVSLSKIHLPPPPPKKKSTCNTQKAVAPSRHDWKIVDWDVKPLQNQNQNLSWAGLVPLNGYPVHKE